MEEKINLLYAEDDIPFAHLIKKILRESGFEVEIASNGIEAWDKWIVRRPDILLLDMEMPGKDGLEVVRLIREADKRFPIVMYSNYFETDLVKEAYAMDVIDYIHKEINIDLLIAKLKSIFRRIYEDKLPEHVIRISPNTFFNFRSKIIEIKGEKVILTSMDAKMLSLLCMHICEWVDGSYLSQGMWNLPDKIQELQRYVHHLRKILKKDPSILIENLYGGRYRLCVSK